MYPFCYKYHETCNMDAAVYSFWSVAHLDCSCVQVQYKYGLESFERLKDAGVNVTMKTYRNLGHSLAQQELADIREFLSDVLPAE